MDAFGKKALQFDRVAHRWRHFLPFLRRSTRFMIAVVSPLALLLNLFLALQRYALADLDAMERYLAERKHVH